ncbi:MAG: type II toxin-antitoxin system HipA family toxin [Lachnospiraceae bacterium]|nr:type II toxin-antitoxin system HipA family toxin [Lachnospiraceae bacterium]
MQDGFSISPFSLPLEDRVFVPKSDVFEGLFGVFSDSLPDGWGRLLVDRMLLSKSIQPASVGSITRLGIVGSSGMGALEYVPELWPTEEKEYFDLEQLARECELVFEKKDYANLDELFQLGGSPGGARPKVLVKIEDEPWMVKFPSPYDSTSIGKEEYCYMKCAASCGIDVPEVQLFPSGKGEGYFGCKRFDRRNGRRVHMITASGLLETSHRIPNLDYHDLMKLTYILTRDTRQMEELYRRMCFNVFAHNRDDHSKNFSYFYGEQEGRWQLTPAYDLTYSNSIGGEHATCIDGNGRNPGVEELVAVGKATGLSKTKLLKIAEEIREIVECELKDFLVDIRR